MLNLDIELYDLCVVQKPTYKITHLFGLCSFLAASTSLLFILQTLNSSNLKQQVGGDKHGGEY